jgi:hypothetical protein
MAFTSLLGIPLSKDQVAVAVSHSNLGAGHVGLAFHSAKHGLQVLHLAWHRRLMVERIPDELKTCWASSVLQLPPSASKQVVAYLRTVASRGAQINYSMDFIAAKGSFAPSGAYKPPKNSRGLTCSSFIVETLRGAMINLVDETTWRADPQNVAWARGVCDELARHADAEHVSAVRASINGLRLRPFEVAGAGELGRAMWPASFHLVQQPAQVVAQELASVCPDMSCL